MMVISTSGGSQSPGAALAPPDMYFVTQTSIGTPFQTYSGNLAVNKATAPAIRSYAKLMASTHTAVNDALVAILKRKGPVPPPTLLQAAYATILGMLEEEDGHTFDCDYVNGQVEYQSANVALYEFEIAYGVDRDLKAFAQQTLPKIEDNLSRALRLQGELE